MNELPVVNASPLIFLSRAGLPELLRLAGETILVPRAVHDELRERGSSDPAVRLIEEHEWLRVVQTPEPSPGLQAWDLGPGEASVLAWCMENDGAEAILDDLAARNFAAAFRIPVRGTLGLVLRGKQKGLYEEARPILENLRKSGMYLSDHVLDRALEQVGE